MSVSYIVIEDASAGADAAKTAGFGGVRMLGGKLRIDPKLPEAWSKLSYTILWHGQKLAVTVTKDSVYIVNETHTKNVELVVKGKQYTLDQELTVNL